MGDKSPERLPNIGNNEFRDWLRNLEINRRVAIMMGITKGLSMKGVPGFKISEALVQLSQRCSVMLLKLPEHTINHYAKLRRQKLKSQRSKTRHSSSSHLSALTNCANTSRNKNIHTDKEIDKKVYKTSSEQNPDSKKRKRIKERYRELFGEDCESNDLESNPVKKAKLDMVCKTSNVAQNSGTKSKIVQTNKVQKTPSISSDEVWNRMGLPSPAQRSKCILLANQEMPKESPHLANQEIPKKMPQEEHFTPKIGSIRVRSLSELTYNGFQEKTQVDPKDETAILDLIEDETSNLADPEKYESPLINSKEDEIPQADPKEDGIPIAGPKEDETPVDETKEDETPEADTKEVETHLVDKKKDELPIVDPKEAEKCFWIVYNLNFNDQLEKNIKKLGELLWLAGTYAIQRNERVDRAKSLSTGFAMEEMEKAELLFSDLIKYRGNDFAPLFLELFNKFEDSGNSGNKCTLFMMLFCRILHHAQSFNSDNASALDTTYIELAREVTSLMISNYQPGYDIFNDLKIDSQLFVTCLKKSYQLIFPLDESQTISNDNNQQGNQPDEILSLSPAASQLPKQNNQSSLSDIPHSVNSNEVVSNEVVTTNRETESLTKISTIRESSNLQLIRENQPTLSGPQQMVIVQDITVNQDVQPTVISKRISKTPPNCSYQPEPRSDTSHHQSVPCNGITDLNETSIQIGSVQILDEKSNKIGSEQITLDTNSSKNVINHIDDQSVVIGPNIDTEIRQTPSNPGLFLNNQTLLTDQKGLNETHLNQKLPYLPNQHQSNYNTPQPIRSNPPNNQPPHKSSKPNVRIAQNSTQMCQPKAVASIAKPSQQAYLQVSHAVDQFLASKQYCLQNQVRPTCNSSSLNQRAPQRAPQVTRFKIQERPPFAPKQHLPAYNPNSGIPLSYYQLPTGTQQSFVSKTNSFPPVQPRPLYNPNNINHNVQSTSQHTQASPQTLSGQSVHQTRHYAHFSNYTPSVNIQNSGICSQTSGGPQYRPSHSQQYRPRFYIQRAEHNVASILPESRTAPLVSQYRQPSNAANSQCIQGIPQTRRFQPILPKQYRTGSNAANLHHCISNFNGPNHKSHEH